MKGNVNAGEILFCLLLCTVWGKQLFYPSQSSNYFIPFVRK